MSSKKIKNLNDEAKYIGPAAGVVLRGGDAAAFINDWGRTATLPIQLPQSHSLTLYAGMPPILTEHRYWLMAGVDYNSWPGMLRESLLLRNDNKVRFNAGSPDDEEHPHLPEIREEREQKEAIFRRLLATGREGVVIARSLTDASKDPVAESQFVAPLFKRHDPKRGWREAGKVCYPLDAALPDGDGPWFPQAEIICTPVSPAPTHKVPEGRACEEKNRSCASATSTHGMSAPISTGARAACALSGLAQSCMTRALRVYFPTVYGRRPFRQRPPSRSFLCKYM